MGARSVQGISSTRNASSSVRSDLGFETSIYPLYLRQCPYPRDSVPGTLLTVSVIRFSIFLSVEHAHFLSVTRPCSFARFHQPQWLAGVKILFSATRVSAQTWMQPRQ